MSVVTTAVVTSASLVSVLVVVVGTIIRATRAYTQLESAVHELMDDLKKHEVDERAERREAYSAMTATNDRIAARLSIVEQQVNRLRGRAHGTGSA